MLYSVDDDVVVADEMIWVHRLKYPKRLKRRRLSCKVMIMM